MIKTVDTKNKFYYISSGNWETVVMADNRSSALKASFSELLEEERKRDYLLSSVVICFDIDCAAKELSMDQSLKFIPTEDALEEVGEPELAIAIKALLGHE